jgi:hypothetical protein
LFIVSIVVVDVIVGVIAVLVVVSKLIVVVVDCLIGHDVVLKDRLLLQG